MPTSARNAASGAYLMVEASCAHLTVRDRERLAAFSAADMDGEISVPGMRLVPHQYGWIAILFYPDDRAYRGALRSRKLSVGFQRLVAKARRMGARGIDIDQDGHEHADVPLAGR